LIGLDTNVVIRYLVQDDKKQSAAATRFIEKSLTTDAPGYINHITLCEIVWVLQRCYGVTTPQVREIIEGLLTTKQLMVENVEITWKALRAYDAKNADFCDALIGQKNIHSGCEHTVTFDKRAASLPGFDLLG
jgi:predicted nucleic-acid-binding protein